MSVVHLVKVSGKSKEELIKGLKAAISELSGESVGTRHVSFGPKAGEIDDDGEEMEEEISPFSNVASIDRSTVIDNEVDSKGLPWDKRIHSSKKTKVSDGSWKLARGVDKDFVAVVEAELRARVAGSTPVAPAPVHQPAPQQQAPITQPALPQSAPALPPVNQTTGYTLQTFQQNFPVVMSNLITQGKLTQDYVNTLKAHFGVAEIWQANAEQQAACFTEFSNCGIIQRVG